VTVTVVFFIALGLTAAVMYALIRLADHRNR
jgi:hypothetical protein